MRFACRLILILLPLFLVSGCGSTQKRAGTEQLLLSDSVDRSVDQLEFGVLSGRKVYLDTTYIRAVKGNLFVNADYIVSTLRHKLTTSGCLLQAGKEQADYIIEARIGALGTDSLEVTYGLPASNALTQAASLVTSAPPLPSIPEISFGKRNSTLSTSKIVAYAYHRETGTPVWQSGSAIHKSDARDTWVMGAGPIQRGSIYDGVHFADWQIKMPSLPGRSKKDDDLPEPLTIADSHQFVHPAVLEQQIADAAAAKKADVVPASHEEDAEEK